VHSHDEFEDGPEWRRGRRGGRGAGWFGPLWAGPVEGEDEPGEGPGRMWFGGPFAPGVGGPWGGGRGWGRPGARAWGRARRGDVRSAILVLLVERPMHGYEIIGELSERTEGLWRPSPGSIYPTLQLLEDEGLVGAQADESAGNAGKRRYKLTEEGQAAAAELAKGPAPWEQMAAGAPAGARALRHSLGKLVLVARQVGMVGGPREYEEAVRVLDEARRRLYAILAGEQVAGAHAAPAGVPEEPQQGPTAAPPQPT